jgi:glycosyltransferase involved in cell wall biosynthesis
MPKVSVIVPAYNREKYIGQCLDSILNQTYKDLEIIVVDDGSTDSTPEMVEEYRRRYGEKIKFKRLERNRGQSVATNEGIKMAEGEYIAFCDSDDWFHPERIEKMVKVLEENPSKVLVSSNDYIVRENGEIKGTLYKIPVMEHKPYNVFLACIERLAGFTLYWPFMCRRYILELDNFDPALVMGNDKDIILRLAYRYPEGFIGINEFLYFRRQHPSQITKIFSKGTSKFEYIRVLPFYHKFVRLWRRDLALPQEIRARYLALRTKGIRWFATVLLEEGHYKEAFEFYKEIIQDEPLPLRFIYKLFMICPSSGRLAIKFYHLLKGIR